MDSILSYDVGSRKNFYELLGCDELSSTEQIVTEYKKKALHCHPDKSDSPAAAEEFAALQKAREVLADPEKRAQYDKWLRSGLVIPYEEWEARKDMMHTSLHWASKAKKTPALERPEEEDEFDGAMWPSGSWKQDSTSASDALRKFRNYQI